MSGPAYPEGDVLLFNELVTLIEGASLMGLAAEQLAFALETARFVFDEQEALQMLTLRVPGCSPLAPLLNASPGRTRQALCMADTILRALAKERRSGVHRDAEAPEESTGMVRRGDWVEVQPRVRAWRGGRRDQ